MRSHNFLMAVFTVVFAVAAASMLSPANASNADYQRGYAIGKRVGKDDGYNDGATKAYHASYRRRLGGGWSYNHDDYSEGWDAGYDVGYTMGWKLGSVDGARMGRSDADWRLAKRNEMRQRCEDGECR